MKTKHLLFAAALPLAFAACQNEEFESANSTELSKDQRPLVEVSLNFQKGDADTRVSYDGANYGWTADDQIGAFLMDEIKSSNRPFGSTAAAWAGETWLQHYELVDYIHTDYPFSWNAQTEEWQAPSKLQEGNYFFAAPYETYEGQRQLIHRLDGQTQTGGTEADMNKAIAKNQYFIGYAQVKAGSGNKEALKKVIMTPTLAPIKVTLRNIGTVAKDVEKIVVYNEVTATPANDVSEVATALTVDPTNATYGGTDTDGSIKNGTAYNLGTNATSVGSTTVFNYANVIDAKEDVHEANGGLVYNVASGATDYSKGDALRQVVKKSYSASTPAAIEKQAILSFTSPVKVAANNGEIHFAVMVNTIEKVTKNKLMMDIITTQGQITRIDLTEKKEAENGATLGENTVLLNNAVTSLKPGVKNELIIQFDNNSVVRLQELNVDDEAKLLAFINWNGENVRTNTATLLKDVHFTKAMYDALKATGYKGKLAVKKTAGEDGKLIVDNDVPTDVLNILEKSSDATIVLNGARELTKAIAEKLNTDGSTNLTIENQGTLTVKEEVVAYAKLTNYGTIKVDETGKLKGTDQNNKIYNYGMLENSGEIYNVNNAVSADAKGWIKTSAKVNHIASNVAGATVQLTKVTDQVQWVNTNAGTIYLETAEGVTAKALNDQKVSKLTVTGGTIDFNNVDNSTVTELAIKGTVSVEGWNGANPRVSTYHEFKGVDKASISGAVTFTNAGIQKAGSKIVANEDAKLTFSKSVKFTDITFVKGATVNVKADGVVEVDKVAWNNNNMDNLGKFINKATSGTVNVISGNKPETPAAPATDVKFTAEITGSDNIGSKQFATLKSIETYINGGAEAGENRILEGLKISAALTVSASNDDGSKTDNDASYLTAFGAKVELATGGSIKGLTKAMGVEIGELTVSAEAAITGERAGMYCLTVDKLILDAALTLSSGDIRMNDTGVAGRAAENVKAAADANIPVDASKGVIVDRSETLKVNNTGMWEKIN